MPSPDNGRDVPAIKGVELSTSSTNAEEGNKSGQSPLCGGLGLVHGSGDGEI